MKKARARGEDPAEVLRPRPSDVLTMAAAIAVYMETKSENRSQEQERTRFKLHVEPVLGDKPVDKVTKADIDRLLHAMVHKAGMRADKPMFPNSGLLWALLAKGYRHNPMAGMKRPVRQPSQERQKDGTVAVLNLVNLVLAARIDPQFEHPAR
jgi:hypothetical protein